MVSISSLFRFIFVFTVVTVAGIGFLFNEIAFLRLSIVNAALLLLVWIIVRFPKGASTNHRVSKHEKEIDKEPMKESIEEDITDKETESSTTPVHASHHEQVVKYTYHHKKKKKSPFIWIFLLLITVLAVYAAMNRDSLMTSMQPDVTNSLTGYAEDILAQPDTLSGVTTSGAIVESTGEVLSTGSIAAPTTGIAVDKSFVATGETPTTYSSTLKFADTQSVSILEAVVYLMQTHNTPLLTKKDVKFTNVSTTNKYYAYWYTAYKMGLVGKTSSPSSSISCQTYFVIKGMLEKWNIQYTSANVKTVFFAEAQKRDVLNGCVYGSLLKGVNLN